MQGPFLAPQWLWLVSGAFGPCWQSCPPTCPVGASFNWQHCPCHFYSQDLKTAFWLIWLPWGQSPTVGSLPSRQGLQPVWGRVEQTVDCTPMRSRVPLGHSGALQKWGMKWAGAALCLCVYGMG